MYNFGHLIDTPGYELKITRFNCKPVQSYLIVEYRYLTISFIWNPPSKVVMHVVSTPGPRHNTWSRNLKELTQKEEFLSEHTEKLMMTTYSLIYGTPIWNARNSECSSHRLRDNDPFFPKFYVDEPVK